MPFRRSYRPTRRSRFSAPRRRTTARRRSSARRSTRRGGTQTVRIVLEQPQAAPGRDMLGLKAAPPARRGRF